MGSCNPKPTPKQKPTSTNLQYCCKKVSMHLKMKQNSINQEIINGENYLVSRIKQEANQRNKIDELLFAERIVNGLKYTAVYTTLISYADKVQGKANYICENIDDDSKMKQWMPEICSMLYAAERIPLHTLQDLRKCLEYIDSDIVIEQNTDAAVKQYLTPQPTPQELNMYMVEMSERNKLTLEKINEVGHSFTEDFEAVPKSFDQDFREKSRQFRNSLPRKEFFQNDKKGQSKGPSPGGRHSVNNPFDKQHPVEQKDIKDIKVDADQAEKDKVNEDDVSPNITDMMKKLDESRNTFRGE